MSSSNKIVSARVDKVEKHPNASKLKVCSVFDGEQSHSVVCGAHNVREGMITVLATVGSTTPQGVVIQTAELRGVRSDGMLCSPKDLALAPESGIIDLPPATALGTDFTQLSADELSSTPWHQYKKVESFYLDQDGTIRVRRDFSANSPKPQGRLLSETFFHEGQYLYRTHHL